MEDKRANARTQTRGWLFFGKLVAALGGPALGSLGLSTWAKNHKFLAVFLVVLYEAAVFSIGLLSEIWNRLKEKWLAAIAQRIDYQVQGLVSGYRRKYLEHVFYECRNFDVKGLSTQGTYALELQRVFVELSVDAQPLHEVSRNPIPSLPPRLQQGRHDIWEFLNAGHNLALLGSPGSGKTTLLRHIALVLALAHKSSGAKLKPSRIPIVLFLRSHGKDVAANSDISLAAIVGRSDIVKEMHDPPPNEWFERQLAQGRCLVLLDGLDEVADRLQRLKLVQWLEGQIKSYGKNLFLVTSRPYGYRENPLGSVHTLSVRPFSRGQVQRFVENWYLANEIVSHNYNDPGVRKEAEKGTRDLMRRINGSEVLTELAVNPLLLTMIATVHKYRSELPGRRVELYREICEVFLGKRQDVRGVERVIDLTPSQKQCVLEPLAYHMMMMRTREIDANAAASLIKEALLRVSPSTAPEDFLRVIEDTSGVVLERESGEFAFAHKTFQEYLASVHCRRQHLETDLANTVKDNWWHETIRLYVAQGDATQILLACLQDNVPTSEAIVLAVECLEEAQQVDRDCRQRLETILANEAEDESRQRVYGESLLRLRLKRMVSLDEKCWVDTKLVTQAEYQVFVDERRAKKFARQPDSWYSTHFAPGQGGTPIIGIRASDAADFVRWLGEKDETWLYRLPGERELAGERLRLAHSRTELNQSGCWSTTSGGENRLIASLEPRRRDQFLEGFWRFAEKLWTEDLRAVSALLDDWSDSDNGDVLSSILDLNAKEFAGFDYDRTLDLVQKFVQPRAGHLKRAVVSVLHQDVETVLERTGQLSLWLPHGETFEFYLDRQVPRIDSFSQVATAQLMDYPRSRREGRIRNVANLLQKVILDSAILTKWIRSSPLWASPSRMVSTVEKRQGRDLYYARINILPLLASSLLAMYGAGTSVPISNHHDLCIRTLFDLYVQFALIEGQSIGDIPSLGGIRVVREQPSEMPEAPLSRTA